MKRIFLSFLVLCVVVNLVACTVVANRIYTVCKIDGSTSYVYNNKGEFFTKDGDRYLKHSGAGLECKPALQLVSTNKVTYNFDKQMVGMYKGTLEDVSAYVYQLSLKSYSTVVNYADCKDLELFCVSEDMSVRILFNLHGTVRIYAVDKDGYAIEPPMLE